MPNRCTTHCTVMGAYVEIERFKAACLELEPRGGDHNGIDFERIIPMPLSVRESKELVELKLGVRLVSVPVWYNWRLVNWGTKCEPLVSRYYVEDGYHKLFLETVWAPPIPVLEKIIAMFPALSLIDLRTYDDQLNFFWKGTISASGTDLQEDEEAIQEFEDAISRCEEDDAAGRQRGVGDLDDEIPF
jgi:hypothetical protein